MPFVAANIDEVLAQLAQVVATWKAQNNRLGYFAALYRQVTLEVKRGIVLGTFDDGPRMDRFDTAFGNRFFAALDAWQSGAQPPSCWRVAFELTTNRDTIILQHLLLGVNAHINLDLAVAAAAASAASPIEELSRDYDRINDIIVSVLGKVQAALDDVSPYLWLLDELGGRSDEAVLDFSIRTARAQAWNNALLLSRFDPAQDELLIGTMDRAATVLARLIARPAGILRPALEVIRHAENSNVAAVVERLDHALDA